MSTWQSTSGLESLQHFALNDTTCPGPRWKEGWPCRAAFRMIRAHGKGIMERLYLHKGHSTFLKWCVFVCQDSTPKKKQFPCFESRSTHWIYMFCLLFLLKLGPSSSSVSCFFFRLSKLHNPVFGLVTSFWFAKNGGHKMEKSVPFKVVLGNRDSPKLYPAYPAHLSIFSPRLQLWARYLLASNHTSLPPLHKAWRPFQRKRPPKRWGPVFPVFLW